MQFSSCAPYWIDASVFDVNHGPCFIDEKFASIRYRDGGFHCGQINILMAFNDIGPRDGATVVIPGSHKSHKSNIMHPEFDAVRMSTVATSADGITATIEVHLRVGDVLLFVDAIMQGSAARTNRGQRRMAVYRYGPS